MNNTPAEFSENTNPNLIPYRTYHPKVLNCFSLFYHISWLILAIITHYDRIKDYPTLRKIAIHYEYTMMCHCAVYVYCVCMIIWHFKTDLNGKLARFIPYIHSFVTINQILVAIFYWIVIHNSKLPCMILMHGGWTLLGFFTYFFIHVKVRFTHIKWVFGAQIIYICVSIMFLQVLMKIYPEFNLTVQNSRTYQLLDNLPVICGLLALVWTITGLGAFGLWSLGYIMEKRACRMWQEPFDDNAYCKCLRDSGNIGMGNDDFAAYDITDISMENNDLEEEEKNKIEMAATNY